MERMGTPSGRTRLEVKIKDCGQALEEDEYGDLEAQFAPQVPGDYAYMPK